MTLKTPLFRPAMASPQALKRPGRWRLCPSLDGRNRHSGPAWAGARQPRGRRSKPAPGAKHLAWHCTNGQSGSSWSRGLARCAEVTGDLQRHARHRDHPGLAPPLPAPRAGCQPPQGGSRLPTLGMESPNGPPSTSVMAPHSCPPREDFGSHHPARKTQEQGVCLRSRGRHMVGLGSRF